VIAPRFPADEAERQAQLDGLDILDTPAEPAFSNIARLAAHVCGTPVALVSLVDRRRQWFKAKVGVTLGETPREHSFCGHALESDQPMIVPDALADPRFHDNPLVNGDPIIRFYAGVPLRLGEGSALGTLCVIDRVPRELSASQIAALRLLAEQVTVELRLRAELRRRGDSAAPAVTAPLAERETMPGVSRAPAIHHVPTPDEAPVVIGARLEDRYQIEEAIGRGGMGFVFGARDLRDGRRVAIKFLRQPSAEEAIERFAREARAVMRLGSEHVARLLDVGNTEAGVPFIVMERLEGEELGAAIARRGRLPASEAVALLLEACEVLGEAHDAGIVHRDIKPANLFLARGADGIRLKVLDFGIAKFASPSTGAHPATTLAFTILGSPYYMAPEQVMGASDVDARADIWSLGVVLFEMVTGQLPFRGDGMPAVCQAVLTEPTPDAGVPALTAVIARCLQKKREERYGSVWELARDLASIG
jgi:serine/threonine-protein kinase